MSKTAVFGKQASPFRPLDEAERKIILGLAEKCEQLDLWNVHFESGYGEQYTNFYLDKDHNGWRLTVVQDNKNRQLDGYRVDGQEIIYNHSERD